MNANEWARIQLNGDAEWIEDMGDKDVRSLFRKVWINLCDNEPALAYEECVSRISANTIERQTDESYEQR